MNQTGFWVLGVLVTAFFALIWRRFDALEKKIDGVDTKLTKLIADVDTKVNGLTGDFREFKGRTDALLGFVKPSQPAEVKSAP